MSALRKACGLVVLAFGGCAATPLEIPGFDASLVRDVAIEQFVGAGELLAAFDARDEAERRSVDAALFGVEAHRDGEVTRRLLWLESEREPDAGRRRSRASYFVSIDGERQDFECLLTPRDVSLRYLRDDGQLVSESCVSLHDELMRVGFWSADVSDPRVYGLVHLYVNSLGSLASVDEKVREMLLLVVDAPSVFSVVANLGVSVRLGVKVPSMDRFRWSDPPRAGEGWGEEFMRVQVEMRINSSMAMLGDLVVCDPVGPLALSGGVCGAVLRHPSDATRWAVVRLLAVRGG